MSIREKELSKMLRKARKNTAMDQTEEEALASKTRRRELVTEANVAGTKYSGPSQGMALRRRASALYSVLVNCASTKLQSWQICVPHK